jgi:uncharacterized protein (UPF0147 family)
MKPGMNVTVKIADMDMFKKIVAILKAVTLDERIDSNIRNEYEKEISGLFPSDEGGES